MKSINQYFKEDQIIRLLCKMRAKLAQSRSEKHILTQLTKSQAYNYHKNESNQPEFLNITVAQLNACLPSRRNWVKLGSKSRYSRNKKSLISSFDKNYYCLFKTIKRDKLKNPNLGYLVTLKEFIDSIQSDIKNNTITIETPMTMPKPKKKINPNSLNECRPISIFNLRDRIVLSLTNKYFTELLDPYFLDCSFAFRSKNNRQTGKVLSHHDCIVELLRFKRKSRAKKMWVVECDIKKFFDTVSHKKLKRSFESFLGKIKKEHPHLDLETAKNIFYQYLDRYSFSSDISPLNEDADYWLQYDFLGCFPWVKNEIRTKFRKKHDSRIGVPQGGALSGLISNILLHEVDKKMSKLNVFYVRFCDDMLIVSPYFNRANEAKSIYLKNLSRAKLLAHDFDENFVWSRSRFKRTSAILLDNFYKSKSKGPYKWSTTNESVKWISFVGYELNFEGEIRIRKKSLDKEIRKQNDLLKKVKKAISKNRRSTSLSTIQTLTYKLIGMSVGRVTMRNFHEIINEMCWVSGFRMLDKSHHAKIQLKKLDRNRNKTLNEFSKFIFKQENVKSTSINKTRQLIKYNKPFSYYYHMIDKKE